MPKFQPLDLGGPTARILSALVDGPKTSAEIQEAADVIDADVTDVFRRQKSQGNMTRVDGRTGAGFNATYAITEAGLRRIGVG